MSSRKHFTHDEYELMMSKYRKTRTEKSEQKQEKALVEEILSYCKAYQAIEEKQLTSLDELYYYFGSTGINPYFVYEILMELEKDNTLYIYARKIKLLNIEEERNAEIY